MAHAGCHSLSFCLRRYYVCAPFPFFWTRSAQATAPVRRGCRQNLKKAFSVERSMSTPATPPQLNRVNLVWPQPLWRPRHLIHDVLSSRSDVCMSDGIFENARRTDQPTLMCDVREGGRAAGCSEREDERRRVWSTQASWLFSVCLREREIESEREREIACTRELEQARETKSERERERVRNCASKHSPVEAYCVCSYVTCVSILSLSLSLSLPPPHR